MTRLSRGTVARLGHAVIAQIPDNHNVADDVEEPPGEMFVRIGERMVASWSCTPYRAPDPKKDLADLRKRLAEINADRRELEGRLRRAIDVRDEFAARSVTLDLGGLLRAAGLAEMLIIGSEHRLARREVGWCIDRTKLSLAELVGLAIMEAGGPEPERPGMNVKI